MPYINKSPKTKSIFLFRLTHTFDKSHSQTPALYLLLHIYCSGCCSCVSAHFYCQVDNDLFKSFPSPSSPSFQRIQFTGHQHGTHPEGEQRGRCVKTDSADGLWTVLQNRNTMAENINPCCINIRRILQTCSHSLLLCCLCCFVACHLPTREICFTFLGAGFSTNWREEFDILIEAWLYKKHDKEDIVLHWQNILNQKQ